MEKLKASYYFTAAPFSVCQCFHYELQFSGVYNSAIKILLWYEARNKSSPPQKNSSPCPAPPFFFFLSRELNWIWLFLGQVTLKKGIFFVTFCTIIHYGWALRIWSYTIWQTTYNSLSLCCKRTKLFLVCTKNVNNIPKRWAVVILCNFAIARSHPEDSNQIQHWATKII